MRIKKFATQKQLIRPKHIQLGDISRYPGKNCGLFFGMFWIQCTENCDLKFYGNDFLIFSSIFLWRLMRHQQYCVLMMTFFSNFLLYSIVLFKKRSSYAYTKKSVANFNYRIHFSTLCILLQEMVLEFSSKLEISIKILLYGKQFTWRMQSR